MDGPRWSSTFRLRKLRLRNRNISSSLFRIPLDAFDDNNITDPFEQLLEEIEYNRATAEIGANFALGFTLLGAITICINIVILAILSVKRRLILQQVFYLLIINFAIIDTLKGVCLASHALRFILPVSVFQDRKVLGTKIDQHVFVFFRLFNLATIFNLLMITLNEYTFIKYPLRYHQLVRRKLVLILVLFSWVTSISFTIASSLAKGKDETVFISTNSSFRRDRNEPYNRGGQRNQKVNVRRSGITTDMDLHTVFMFALTGFCIFSLLVVLVCYAIFFSIIRNIQKNDRKLRIDANRNRRVSEVSINSTDIHNLDERKIKRQLVKRYKYVLVIGSVILVYMLYLISYSSIQILQYFNLNRRTAMTSEQMRNMLITRWVLVLLCGLHSTIQPTCYFRMKEFRELILKIFIFPCKQRRRRNSTELTPSFSDGQRKVFQNVGNDIRRRSCMSNSRDEIIFQVPQATKFMNRAKNGSTATPKQTVIRFHERNSLKFMKTIPVTAVISKRI